MMPDLEILHFLHPKAKVSTAFSFRLEFLGAIQNVKGRFMRIHSRITGEALEEWRQDGGEMNKIQIWKAKGGGQENRVG